MTDQKQSRNTGNREPFGPLCTALRRQIGDAQILDLVEALKMQGHGTEVIVARVVRSVGNDAGVRVQKIAGKRAEYMTTGTWKRYKMSRGKRFRLWMRDVHDSVEDAVQRLRRAS